MTRDGWYLLGFGTKKLLRDGVAMSAVVRSAQPYEGAWDMTLEVQPPGGAPYEVQGLFGVADDLVQDAKPGVTVPIKVHPSKPMRVAIDWDTWRASRGGASP